jgi:hypothetical protein
VTTTIIGTTIGTTAMTMTTATIVTTPEAGPRAVLVLSRVAADFDIDDDAEMIAGPDPIVGLVECQVWRRGPGSARSGERATNR